MLHYRYTLHGCTAVVQLNEGAAVPLRCGGGVQDAGGVRKEDKRGCTKINWYITFFFFSRERCDTAATAVH